PQLALPGRRLEAITAVERHLIEAPDDPAIWGLKRMLYQDLTEREYLDWVRSGGAANAVDPGYVQQLGQALLGDSARWQRGGEYLRIAAQAQPALAPTILIQLAKAHDRAGDPDGAWRNYESAKIAGRTVGPKNLAEPEKLAYFSVVKMLAEAAEARGDHDAAIENYQLYGESEKSGIETLRPLAALHEAQGDLLAALRVTERALLYSGKDKEFLDRKKTYYRYVTPDQVRPLLDSVRSWFDVDYCLRLARELLGPKYTDLDYLEWASHLVELARVVRPDDRAAKVLLARTLLRRGEKSEAVALLEAARTPKPESFESG